MDTYKNYQDQIEENAEEQKDELQEQLEAAIAMADSAELVPYESPLKKKRGKPKGAKSKPKMITLSTEAFNTQQKALAKANMEIAKLKGEAEAAKRAKKGNSGLNHGDSSEIIAFLGSVHKIGANADTDNVQSLQECWIKYCNLCVKRDMNLNNLAAYMALGITKATADDWLSGRERADRPEFRDLIISVNQMCSAYREQLMSEGKMNTITGVWWQKNFDKMKDNPTDGTTEINATDRNKTPEEILEKYGDLLI